MTEQNEIPRPVMLVKIMGIEEEISKFR